MYRNVRGKRFVNRNCNDCLDAYSYLSVLCVCMCVCVKCVRAQYHKLVLTFRISRIRYFRMMRKS